MFGKPTRSLTPYRLKLDELQEREHFENRRGETIPYSTFESAMGLSRKDGRFISVMASWRKHMLDTHGIDITAVSNVGYSIPSFGEQLRNASGRFGRGMKQFRHGEKSADGSKPGLSNTQMKAADFLMALSANVRSQVRGAARVVLKQCDEAQPLLTK